MITLTDTLAINARSIAYLSTKKVYDALNLKEFNGFCSKNYYLCRNEVNKVFADLTDLTNENKNDKTYLINKSTSAKVVSYHLVKNGTTYNLNNNTFGQYFNVGNLAPNTIGYIINWSNVMSVIGAGKYDLIVRTSDAGGNIINEDCTCYELMPYDCAKLDGTIKLFTTKKGYIEGGNNYQLSVNWHSEMRFYGMFEINNHVTKIDNIILANRVVDQIQTQVINNYKLTLIGILPQQAEMLINDEFLSNTIQISDFNKNGLSKFDKKAVSLVSISDPIKHKINGTFTYEFIFEDKIQNIIKRNF